ncbi:DNA polymerase III subunit delta [Legionella londiniensis]|uniref:DNA polymerase III subunit delta n=1 Tax=Legionella londiniensis TaxID=45068 RepID=A0A0W0VM79_9GAMM|nr:DNA polymerase III subunit delta [Legionella londiniensis]KTD21250.1 DNA polymerase III, delta subunit [Legionella londiniensis]STX93276.1 DNA polymerase III, delta subunit [Legionella londiniensis]
MHIQYQALESSLKKQIYPVYVIFGQDHYLLNDAALRIKNAWRSRGECDTKIIDINTPSDWAQLLDEANNYSLFSDLVLIDVRYEKKTIDQSGKKILQQYLQSVNPRCLVILQAPELQAKQLGWLNEHANALCVQVYSFNESTLKNWIVRQLQQRGLQYSSEIPALIYQYTEGNMLACAQAIEKISLISSQAELLTAERVQAQLIDQCEYHLYELADACLAAHCGKALHLLRQARHNRTEPTLILWLMTQEIRQLIQLTCKLRQKISFAIAGKELKIWPQKFKIYQTALARLSLPVLYELLRFCRQLDERIKTNHPSQIWELLERLALSFCQAPPPELDRKP